MRVRFFGIGVLVLALSPFAQAAAQQTAPAQSMDEHKIIRPDDVKWAAAPPLFEKGAELAVLYGDPSKEGPFAMRFKMPEGYVIAPHTHPDLRS